MKQKLVIIYFFLIAFLLVSCQGNSNNPHHFNAKMIDSLSNASKESNNINNEIQRVMADTNLFHDGLAIIQIGGKFGFIDKTGRVVTPIKYNGVHDFHDGLAVVQIKPNDGSLHVDEIPYKYGFIDKTGKEVTLIKYDNADDLSYGLAKIEIHDYDQTFHREIKYGFIDKTGKELTQIKYDNKNITNENLYSFRGGLRIVGISGKLGFIDTTGKEVTPIKYDHVYNFNEGLAVVGCNDKYGYIDTLGHEVIPPKYDKVEPFYNGLANVGVNGKYGFVDRKGKEVTPIMYDNQSNFSEGLAIAAVNSKYGFIDTAGNVVIPFNYDMAEGFSNGLARVYLVNNGVVSDLYIDKTGRICKINESPSNKSVPSVANSQTGSNSYDLSNTTKTCSWCGKSFTGKAWTVSMGEPVQWKYLGACSQKCAMESYKSKQH
jgi:hypothetical protein